MVRVQSFSPPVFSKNSHGLFELLLRNRHFDVSDGSGVERIHPAQFCVQEEGFQTTAFQEPDHELRFQPIRGEEDDSHRVCAPMTPVSYGASILSNEPLRPIAAVKLLCLKTPLHVSVCRFDEFD